MSRRALCCAVLLLAIAWPAHAVDNKEASTATGDSWAPLPTVPTSAGPALTPQQTVRLKEEERKRTVPLNQAPLGYHDVKLKGGGVVRVSDEASAVSSHSSGDTYDPSDADFSRTSSYAGKNFSTANTSLSRRDGAGIEKKAYATSSYGSGSTFQDGSHPFQTAAYKGTRENSDFSKSYALPNPADYDRSFATKTSDFQGKPATLTSTGKPADPFAKPWAEGDKRFFDPTTLHVPHKSFNVSSSVHGDPNSDTITDLPNRPLSVDEVRNLINHDQAPDINAKPGAQSRALNDPAWEPPLKLPEISERAASATPPPDEARENELPSPGMMSQPGSAGVPAKR